MQLFNERQDDELDFVDTPALDRSSALSRKGRFEVLSSGRAAHALPLRLRCTCRASNRSASRSPEQSGSVRDDLHGCCVSNFLKYGEVGGYGIVFVKRSDSCRLGRIHGGVDSSDTW